MFTKPSAILYSVLIAVSVNHNIAFGSDNVSPEIQAKFNESLCTRLVQPEGPYVSPTGEVFTVWPFDLMEKEIDNDCIKQLETEQAAGRIKTLDELYHSLAPTQSDLDESTCIIIMYNNGKPEQYTDQSCLLRLYNNQLHSDHDRKKVTAYQVNEKPKTKLCQVVKKHTYAINILGSVTTVGQWIVEPAECVVNDKTN